MSTNSAFIIINIIYFIIYFSKFVFQLFREVRIMKTLNHPNIGE